MSDAFWDPTDETLPHGSPWVIGTQAAFGPWAFWLSKLPLSFLGFGQHLSFLLFRTPDSVLVTFCRLPNTRGRPEFSLWQWALLVSLCYRRVSMLT